LAVITPEGLNPGCKVCKWIRVRMSKPLPANRTTVNATSPAISICRRRSRSPLATVRLAIDERKLTLRTASAGNMPNSTLVSTETTNVKTSTRPSSGTPATGR
jgi:hypothetical protein